ncbi:hypothetical protein NC652_023332 [Populus alba x Populus x berolinensis]|uniref:Uncharacterized protein n=1 Tax=Populus alba TaxID=43335 RepID=A0A4V6XWT8_POPAL|nr:hypothetical protein NC652_023332 [Populus alba x Populus x berolinensis]TKS01766.1 hypothetical protein D5086_0000168730 [Populus alba]
MHWGKIPFKLDGLRGLGIQWNHASSQFSEFEEDVRALLIFSIQGSENIRTPTSEPNYLLPRSQQTKKQSDARMTNRAEANCLRMNETTIVYDQEFLEKGYDMQRHLHCLATATHETRAGYLSHFNLPL